MALKNQVTENPCLDCNGWGELTKVIEVPTKFTTYEKLISTECPKCEGKGKNNEFRASKTT